MFDIIDASKSLSPPAESGIIKCHEIMEMLENVPTERD